MNVILVTTPVSHISGLVELLSTAGDVVLAEETQLSQLAGDLAHATAVFTNPNKALFFMGKEFFEIAPKLQVVSTASTGTNHIDLRVAAARGVEILSLTREFETLQRITSTAEHAVALTLAGLRNLLPACASVKVGEWDYLPFIGRQLSALTVGVVGHGRLGSMYARYVQQMAGHVLFYDPFVGKSEFAEKVQDLETLIARSDVISVHVHHTPDTEKMIGKQQLQVAKPDLLVVNTARGEVFDERALVSFLRRNPSSKLAADVVSREQSRSESLLYRYALSTNQIILSPHVGGMTLEGQRIAFEAAAVKLKNFLEQRNL